MSAATEQYRNLNVISTQLQEYVEKKKPANGKPAVFRILRGEKNHNPLTNNITPIFMGLIDNIPLYSEIRDPGNKGQRVIIGVVDGWDNGFPRFATHQVRTRLQMGKFEVNPDETPELFQFLVLSNDNSSNEFRVSNRPPIFEMIDTVAVAKSKLRNHKKKGDANQLLRDMDYETMQTIAATYPGIQDDGPDELEYALAQRIEKEAADTTGITPAEEFIKKATDVNLPVYVSVLRAVKGAVISHRADENKVTWANTGETIATLPRTDGKTWVETFVDWLKTSENGAIELKNIQTFTDKDKVKNKPSKSA